ncbi:MAG: zinc ribbon domain-containing protein [Coprothermobacterota bacterium]|nr:zinc ribbon domain-containing protein [Coprothermobacterota bacterium]
MYCRNCGKEIPPGVNFCPSCGARVGEVQVFPAQPAQARLYNPVPDLIVLLADILIIVAFFVPWITLGFLGYPSESFSPLRILQEGGVAWWVYVLPIAVLIAGFLELLLSLFRILSRGKGAGKRWWYFGNGMAYILVAVLWWLLVLYAPALEYQGIYYSLNAFIKQGVQVGFGAGLILIIIAGVLELGAGVTAYAVKR